MRTKRIEEHFCPTTDMTFITLESYTTAGEIIDQEVVGFYYGEPNDAATKMFFGKLKAEF